jgi:hypothetical protein
MQNIWMAIHANATQARVLAMAGPQKTLLKATLAPEPAHPRALPTLMEAIAMWQGQKVRAALCVDASKVSFDTDHYPAVWLENENTPLYELSWVPVHRRQKRCSDIRGLGDFRDLRQRMLFEVAR